MYEKWTPAFHNFVYMGDQSGRAAASDPLRSAYADLRPRKRVRIHYVGNVDIFYNPPTLLFPVEILCL